MKISPRRILIAEDSPTQRQIIKTVLGREGYDVLLAEDGIEAYGLAVNQVPDLAVLDIEMPRMNGYQVCRLLKDDRRTRHIPVIMLTSRSQEADKYWGLKTGADRYVTKDFKLAGLADEINQLLSQNPDASPPVPEPRAIETVSQDQGDADVLSRVNDLLDRQLYEATIINEISRLNTLSEDSSVTINSVLSVIARVTDCDITTIILLEEKKQYLHVRNNVGRAFYEEARVRAIDEAAPYLPNGIKPASIPAATDADPAFIQEQGENHQQIQSILTLPLAARGEVVAVLTLCDAKKDYFTEDTRRLLEIVQFPASIVLDNARLHEGARRMAVTDGLTRLINHRHFYELLSNEFMRTCRYKSQISMMMIDIDNFKAINDTYGHQVGDDILKGLAQLAAQEVREVDILARYGGEEFAVLLPQTNIEQAAAVAERIRRTVEKHEFDTGEVKIKLTISLGVAGFPSSGIESHVELVQAADLALYRAKNTGKNRVEIGGEYGAAEAI